MAGFGWRGAMIAALMVVSGPVLAQNAPDDFNAMSSADLMGVVSGDAHPVAYYVLAGKLFEEGRKDEAVYWYYAGQLRFRVLLTCHPERPADADGAVFSALTESIGRPINEYAFGDTDTLVTTFNKVLAAPVKVEAGCEAALEQNLAGLTSLRDQVIAQVEDIRWQRRRAGLENRTE